MDLWDVAKVMWRRRGVTVPLLLLTVVGAVFSLLTIPPSYSARAQVAFLPAVAAQGENPFHATDLAEFISISLNRSQTRRELGQDGLATDYRVTFKPDNLPLIGLEVTGRQEEVVHRTVERLIRMVEAEAVKLQANVPSAQAVTVNAADRGDDLVVVRRAGRRALTVIAGIGLLITAAVALAVDALVRRRSRSAAPPPRQLVPRQSALAPSDAAKSVAAPQQPEPPREDSPPQTPPASPPDAKPEAAETKPANAPADLGNAVTVLLDQASDAPADNEATIPLPLAGVSRPTGKPQGVLAAQKSGDKAGRGKKR